MPDFWMCLMQYIAESHTVQIIEQLLRETFQNTIKHF